MLMKGTSCFCRHETVIPFGSVTMAVMYWMYFLFGHTSRKFLKDRRCDRTISSGRVARDKVARLRRVG